MKKLHPINLDDTTSSDSDSKKRYINKDDGLKHEVRTIRGRQQRPLALSEGEPDEGYPTWLTTSSVTRAVLTNILSVSSIFMGVIYIGPSNCPGQPMIAPLLLASGILGLMLSIMDGCCWATPELAEDEDPQQCLACRFLTAILSLVKIALFLFFGFIVILLWTSYEPEVCNPKLFYYSLAQIFIVVSFMVLYCLHRICVAVFNPATSD